MPTRLSGQLEHITFTNQETGITIAKVKVPGRHEPVTVVGTLLAPTPGEVLEMVGEWTSHPRFGDQFKVEEFTTKVPGTVHGIVKYLGSGLIKGLGPVMAGRIVERFGKNTLDVIAQEIGRLAEVPGVGAKPIAVIARAWEAQRDMTMEGRFRQYMLLYGATLAQDDETATRMLASDVARQALGYLAFTHPELPIEPLREPIEALALGAMQAAFPLLDDYVPSVQAAIRSVALDLAHHVADGTPGGLGGPMH